jgi:nucleoid DNA-binding protein
MNKKVNKKTVGKQLLSFTLQQKHNLAPKDAASIIETFFETIEEQLLQGNSVNLMNIGSIVPVARQTGVKRKAFGKEIVTNKSVNLKITTSVAFSDKFERVKGKSAKSINELTAFSKALQQK